VPVVRTLGSVWDSRTGQYNPRSLSGVILVCLTSLRTSNPPMLPKLNKSAFVRADQDRAILAWEQRVRRSVTPDL
jgi:hypothetical protein